MATLVTRYVNTASSGGDGTTNATSGANAAYVSLSAWELAEQTNLVTADQYHVVHCSGTAADTASCSIYGWTTDATHYIEIRSDDPFDGVYSTSKYRMEVADGDYVLKISEDYVNLIGLQFYNHTPTKDANHVLNILALSSGNEILIDNCCLRGHGSASYTQTGLLINDPDAIVKCKNTLFYGFGTGSGDYNVRVQGSSATFFSNVTNRDGKIGFRNESGTMTLKNCLFSNIDTDISDTATLYAYNCRTDNSTFTGYDSGSSNSSGQSFAFINAGADNYGLTGSDTGARDVGMNLSSDASLSVTDDVRGVTRPVNSIYDVGFYEYSSSSSSLSSLSVSSSSNSISSSSSSPTSISSSSGSSSDSSSSYSSESVSHSSSGSISSSSSNPLSVSSSSLSLDKSNYAFILTNKDVDIKFEKEDVLRLQVDHNQDADPYVTQDNKVGIYRAPWRGYRALELEVNLNTDTAYNKYLNALAAVNPNYQPAKLQCYPTPQINMSSFPVQVFRDDYQKGFTGGKAAADIVGLRMLETSSSSQSQSSVSFSSSSSSYSSASISVSSSSSSYSSSSYSSISGSWSSISSASISSESQSISSSMSQSESLSLSSSSSASVVSISVSSSSTTTFQVGQTVLILDGGTAWARTATYYTGVDIDGDSGPIVAYITPGVWRVYIASKGEQIKISEDFLQYVSG